MNVENSDRNVGSIRLEQLSSYLSKDSGKHLADGYQGSVDLYETPFGNYVVKRARGTFLWRLFGEAALRREREIYARLQNVDGVPQCLGLLENKYLVLEHISGQSYRSRQHEIEDRGLFFDRLLKTLKGMHSVGVAHGDLKRKDNLLVGPNEQPFIIDFGLACLRQPYGKRFNRFYFGWLKQYDYNAWIKLKYQGRLESIAVDDLSLYRPMKLERIARIIRIAWQKLTFRTYRTRHR